MNNHPLFFQSTATTEATLRVRSLQTMLRFYCGTLGLQLIAGDSHRAELSATGTSPALLVLEEDPAAPPAPQDAAGLFHIAFLYPHRPALASALKRVLERRHALEGVADHGVSEAIYLADPENNGLELYADRPPENWPQRGTEIAMHTAPLNLHALLQEAAPTGYEYAAPPETRIGHIHLKVSDLPKAEHFYGKLLGFRVRQRDLPGALFLAREGYHHHIGANTWLSRKPANQGALGLSRFSIELGNEAVAPAIEAAKREDRIVSESPAGALLHDFDGIEVLVKQA